MFYTDPRQSDQPNCLRISKSTVFREFNKPGNFNFRRYQLDTLKDEKIQRDYKNLLIAYNLGKILQTKISDHFTISAEVSHNLANEQHDPPSAKVRKLK